MFVCGSFGKEKIIEALHILLAYVSANDPKRTMKIQIVIIILPICKMKFTFFFNLIFKFSFRFVTHRIFYKSYFHIHFNFVVYFTFIVFFDVYFSPYFFFIRTVFFIKLLRIERNALALTGNRVLLILT